MVLPDSTFYPVTEKPVDSPCLNAFEQKWDGGTRKAFQFQTFRFETAHFKLILSLEQIFRFY